VEFLSWFMLNIALDTKLGDPKEGWRRRESKRLKT
jgi:hypothetical protein